MRRFFLILILCLELVSRVHAQQPVTGKVSDKDGSQISGVLIVEEGTNNGTITNEDGSYNITLPSNATLIFSFVGMKTTKELVDGRSEVNVILQFSEIEFGKDKVVTSLGIMRERKSLTYTQQTIQADEFAKSKDINFINSINGKVAGVDIKKSSSGVGGSTRMILRGSKSLTGDSEPLFVVDGIPIANNKGDQPGMWGGIDQGDGISQINKEDIESISFLKGFNAAALYGGQGANGVVLITTKGGKKGKAKVIINSGVSFEKVTKLPELQYKYGAEVGAKESWSSITGKYDDSFVEDYFKTGVNFINSVALSGGNDKTIAYLSFANTSVNGNVSVNKYSKQNVTFKQSTNLFENRLTISSNVMLASESTDNRNPAGYYLNPLTGLYLFPRNGIGGDGMDYYKENYEYFREDRNIMWQNWFVQDHLQSNPYWIINNEPKENRVKRVIGVFSADWNLNDHFNFAVHGSYDYAERSKEEKHYAGSNTTNTHPNGRWDFHDFTDELIYTDAIIEYEETFGNITVNTIAGASYQKIIYGLGVEVNTGINGLIYPNEFYFQNLPSNVQVHSTLSNKNQRKALFANVSLGIKEMFFFELSTRNDWVSNAAVSNNHSYFYPALGLSAIFSELFNLPSWIMLGKVRTSVANGINVVMPEQGNLQDNAMGSLGNITKSSTELNSEKLSSLEFGTDWRFFDGRFGFDFTYYNIKSQDQFSSFAVPSGSGFRNYVINAGEIVNKGIELTVDATPVEKGNFRWKTAINFSQNNNKVVELQSDIEWLNIGSSEGYSARIVEGGSIGDLYVYKFRRNEAGKILFDDNGKPLRANERELIGNVEPDWSLGWNNTLSYNNFDLSFLINAKVGGKVFSQTESMLDGYGVSARTADSRDLGYVAVDGVVESTGVTVTQVDPEIWYRSIGDRNGIGEPYVYDRTNVRLGQFSLSYNFDLSKMNLPMNALTCSLVGQNLFFIYLDAPFDPELAMSTNRNWQSLDNFNSPATRTIGFNVKLAF